MVGRITVGLALHSNPAEAVRSFVMRVAEQVEASGYASDGPLTTGPMETATTNERLNHACRGAYNRLQGAFEAKLVQANVPEREARQLATFITASIEGGLILCRTYHSAEPLRLVAARLGQLPATSTAQQTDRPDAG